MDSVRPVKGDISSLRRLETFCRGRSLQRTLAGLIGWIFLHNREPRTGFFRPDELFSSPPWRCGAGINWRLWLQRLHRDRRLSTTATNRRGRSRTVSSAAAESGISTSRAAFPCRLGARALALERLQIHLDPRPLSASLGVSGLRAGARRTVSALGRVFHENAG